MSDVFISYSRKDSEFAKRLSNALKRTERDVADTTREESAMAVAEEALVFQTDDLSIEEVLEKILEHIDWL